MTSNVSYWVWRGPAGIYASHTKPTWDGQAWVGVLGDVMIINPEAFPLLVGAVPEGSQLGRATACIKYENAPADECVCVGGGS